jgi:hypothetical protein
MNSSRLELVTSAMRRRCAARELGSDQRPLPCEGRSMPSRRFATVQKYLQNSRFVVESIRGCSPFFVWVDVLLVYMGPS